MNIETGEYFACVRGPRLNDSSFILAGFGEERSKDKEPQHDRSWEGDIYLAREVCGPLVAGELVATSSSWHQENLGKCHSFNTNDVQLWPVTRKYAEAMGVTV